MTSKTLRGEDSSEVVDLYDSLEEALTVAREEFISAKKAAEDVYAAEKIALLEKKRETLKQSELAIEWFLDEYNIERINSHE